MSIPSVVDIENEIELTSYLSEAGRIGKPELASFEILRGGVSNKTVSITTKEGRHWVLKQALNQLRVAKTWTSNPDRIFFEAEAMKWFEDHAPTGSVPKLIFEDRASHILAMEAVPEPFHNLKKLLFTKKPQMEYFTKAATLLAAIHQDAYDHIDRLPEILHSTHFFETLRIEPFYTETAKVVPETKLFLERLVEDTFGDRYTLTHGDYSPKNLLVKNHRLILLDHEVAHLGDGSFDLGFFICQLLCMANHMPNKSEYLLNAINLFYETYSLGFDHMTAERENRVIRHAVACLLARVCGKSPMIYLSKKQQQVQLKIGIELIDAQPKSVFDLTSSFDQAINDYN